MRNCRWCNKEFDPGRYPSGVIRRTKLCPECRLKIVTPKPRYCKECKKEITTQSKKRRYCDECLARQTKRVKKIKSEVLENVAVPARSYYDEFAEGITIREIARNEGVVPSKTARVFLCDDDDGLKSVHLVGTKEIVSALGDAMERGKYRVRKWHIKRPEDPTLEAEEADKVVLALVELIESVPRHLLQHLLPRLIESIKDTSIVPIGGNDVKRTQYDKLIEDVVSKKVCRNEGFDPEMSARVVVRKDADGDPELHVFGRSREAVNAVADSVLSLRVSLQRRYIGHNVSTEEEAGLVGDALDELVETIPQHVLPRLGEALKRMGVY